MADGGAGRDTLDLRKSAVRIEVRLDWASPGLCFGPGPCSSANYWLLSIENVIGTRYDDVVYGNDFKNYIKGSFGADLIHGMGGDDRIKGGAGADDLHGRQGDDFLDGGPDSDTADGGADSNIGGVDQDSCYLVEFPSNCSIIFSP